MLKVVELFAGVGGFRIGLEGYNGKSSTSNFKEDIEQNFKVIWSNQWEPLTPTKQSASEIYSKRWPNSNHSNKNIEEVIKNTFKEIPKDFDVLVGGFPCQDYSVASTLKNSGGIEGKKGVLWWRIHDILEKIKKKPKFLILENVDRLLKSPSNQRGRDFAIMLGCLRDLGYVVEWRVINAADYGFAQRRRRVFIIAYHNQNKKIIKEIKKNKGLDWVNNNGALAQSFKIKPNMYVKPFILDKDVGNISDNFGKTNKNSLFLNSGILIDSRVYSFQSEPIKIESKTLESIFNFDKVEKEFYVNNKDLKKWIKLKDSNSVRREKNGFTYNYSMGRIGFDLLNKPSRTIITGEGGKTPSRFKHIVKLPDGTHRRLTPVELERLNGFPDDWTKSDGITNAKRAFFMGNALVCGIPELIGISLFNIFRKNN